MAKKTEEGRGVRGTGELEGFGKADGSAVVCEPARGILIPPLYFTIKSLQGTRL